MSDFIGWTTPFVYNIGLFYRVSYTNTLIQKKTNTLVHQINQFEDFTLNF